MFYNSYEDYNLQDLRQVSEHINNKLYQLFNFIPNTDEEKANKNREANYWLSELNLIQTFILKIMRQNLKKNFTERMNKDI